MLDCLRTQRTQWELDAGLREKLIEFRKLRFCSDKLIKEIEETICEKSLDRNLVYNSAPPHQENFVI